MRMGVRCLGIHPCPCLRELLVWWLGEPETWTEDLPSQAVRTGNAAAPGWGDKLGPGRLYHGQKEKRRQEPVNRLAGKGDIWMGGEAREGIPWEWYGQRIRVGIQHSCWGAWLLSPAR